MSAPLVLDAAAVAAACSPADAVAALRAALNRGLDPAADLPRQAVALDAGQLLLMPSDGGGELAHVGIKLATVAPANPDRGLPRVQGSYVLLDAATLGVVAMLDGLALTTLRTPAVSVAAVLDLLLANPEPEPGPDPEPLRVAVIGSGPQAHGHVATLADVLKGHRELAPVTQLVRDPGRAAPIDGARVVRLGTPAASAALRAADVVVCATSAREPLFDAALIADRTIVLAMGSHEPDARELPADLLARATVVVEDPGAALREAGDIVLAIADGALRTRDLVPMRDVVTGAVRPDPARPVVFKSTGMSWEDLVVAEAVLAGSAAHG